MSMVFLFNARDKLPDAHALVQLIWSQQAITACGGEVEATLLWYATDRKLRIDGGGCADMTRIDNYFAERNITNVISQVLTINATRAIGR